MRAKLGAQLTTTRTLVLVIGVLFALAWAVPSLGASVGKIARTALGRANQAVYHSDIAVSQSNSAKSAAAAASNAANAASNTANQALTKASGIVVPAFARVAGGCASPSGLLGCSFSRSSGVSGVRQTSTAGTYCITASGRTPSTSSWVASVDANGSSGTSPLEALPDSGSGCNPGEFKVVTTANGTGVSTVAFFVLVG
jgi:hypothetical protein